MTCNECPYQGASRAPGVGLDLRRIVVGKAPGAYEALTGNPFSETDGQMVRGLIDEEVGYVYAVECHPGELRTKAQKACFEEARKACRDRLLHDIAGRDVLALGAEAAASVSGKTRAITRIRGSVDGDLDGGPDRATYSYHPGYVARSGGLDSTVGQQFRRDIECWLRPPTQREARILVDPAPGEWAYPEPDVPVVVDIETTGLDPRSPDALVRDHPPGDVPPGRAAIRAYGFAWRAEAGPQAVVFTRPTPDVLALLGRRHLIAQNYAFEKLWLDVHHPGVVTGQWDDTMLLAHALHEDRGPGSYNLDALVRDYAPEWYTEKDELLGGDWAIDPETGKWSKARAVLLAPLDQLAYYCGWDCLKELALYEVFEDALRPVPNFAGPVSLEEHARRSGALRYERVAMPAAPFLDGLSRRGMPFDHEAHGRQVAILERELATLETALAATAKINWGSDDSVRLTFKSMGLKHPRKAYEGPHYSNPYVTETGKPGLDKLSRKGLIALNPEHADLIQNYDAFKTTRHRLSRLEGLVKHALRDGRIHPRFHLAGPRTARLSASSPAVQTFETQQKACFSAPEGYYILEADYSGIEILWMAYLSQDELLLEIVREGRSLHSEVAEGLGVPRRVAKGVNFGVGYGCGKTALKDLLDGSPGLDWGQFSYAECDRMIRNRRRMFPGYEQWCRGQELQARETGQVESVFGAVRRLPAAREGRGQAYGEAMRQAVNAPIQSAASDMNLVRAIELEARYSWLHTWTLTHDSTTWVVKNPEWAAKRIRTVMEDPEFYWGRLDPVPRVEFKVGKNWAELEVLEP